MKKLIKFSLMFIATSFFCLSSIFAAPAASYSKIFVNAKCGKAWFITEVKDISGGQNIKVDACATKTLNVMTGDTVQLKAIDGKTIGDFVVVASNPIAGQQLVDGATINVWGKTGSPQYSITYP